MGVPFYYDVKLITSGNIPGDFGVNYHNDNISFASLRNKGSKTYKWNEAPYLDIFEGTQQIQQLIVARQVLGKSSTQLK